MPTKCPACGRTVAAPGQKSENPPVEAVELLVKSPAAQTAPPSTNDAPAKDDGAASAASPKQAAAGKDRGVRRLVAWLLLIAALVTGVPGGMYWHASYRVGVLEEDAAQLPKRREAKLKAAERGERDRHLLLIVTGPGTIQPGAPNQYQIQTRNLNDDPAAAEALPVEPWMKLPGSGFVGYGQPSKYEEKVARTWNTAPGTTGAGAARTPHQDVITWAINAKPSPCRS